MQKKKCFLMFFNPNVRRGPNTVVNKTNKAIKVLAKFKSKNCRQGRHRMQTGVANTIWQGIGV